MSEYTPNEVLEAKEKAEQHKEGQKQAEFYRALLDFIGTKVAEVLDPEHTGSIENTQDQLDRRGLDADSLRKYVKEAIETANQKAGTQEVMVSINCEELSQMTAQDFFNYLDSLKTTLIK
ncbi:hypothetical protein GYA13_00935 [Candidatus Kuenenbacteria bacterium]|nr:hypothetical protein [Candidatus Kuenenbacteria bacterium]